jgi:UDP-N-acetylmuramoylalanine--D-glutamate ligase
MSASPAPARRELRDLVHAQSDWRGLRACVAGLGIAGFAAADALLDVGAEVLVIDSGDSERQRERGQILEVLGATVRLGSSDSCPDDTDVYIVSPGIIPTAAICESARSRGIPIWGELELAWRMRPETDPAPWLCVTGTNGKTTTTLMLASMLSADGRKAGAAGNVGTSLVDAVRARSLEVIAVEVSATQMPFVTSMSPEAAVCVNIAPDHLDFFSSMEDYAFHKAAVYRNSQRAAVYNADEPATEQMVRDADVIEGCRAIGFTLGVPAPGMLGVVDGVLVDRAFVADRATHAQELATVDDVPLAASAYVADALAAAALARAHGVAPSAIREGLRRFTPAPHRMARVGRVRDVVYVDDSKATNAHAAATSLRAFSPVVWIAGGLAKGQDFGELVADVAPRLRGVVLLGADRDLIADALARHAPDVPVSTVTRSDTGAMQEVVVLAARMARPGDTVLLAPGCASWDMFRDYGDRGDRFARAVIELGDG